MKILVIEDEQGLAALLREHLTKTGHEVRVAGDALLGVQEAHRFMPEVILLDLMLPAGGGKIVLNHLNASNRTRAIKIIVGTGTQDETLKREIMKFGMVKAYFQKPFVLNDLSLKIQNLVQSSSPSMWD